MNEQQAYIALNMMEGIGPLKARALIAAFGSPQAIFQAAASDLVAVPGIGAKLATRMIEQRDMLDPGAEEDRARRSGARILTPVDEAYPERLRQIYDPPLALYVRGALKPVDRHGLAVVGSRRCTHYGASTADRFAYQLAQTGFTIVSGLARGIDQAAHQGAIKAGGRTLAVLGSGLDRLYPPESENLAASIAEHGAVISEFCMGRSADRTTFPYRNRIIAGLSMGVLVVEASLGSGALMTADAAMEQGKSVMAVPGRIDHPAARGSNTLLKQGARLVDDLQDVLGEFEFLVARPSESPSPASPRPEIRLTEEERLVVEALIEGELDVDMLVRQTGLSSATLSVTLLGLEMKRVIRMLPGRRASLTVEI